MSFPHLILEHSRNSDPEYCSRYCDWLRDGLWKIMSSLSWIKIVPFFTAPTPNMGRNQSTNLMGVRVLCPEKVKRLRLESDHLIYVVLNSRYCGSTNSFSIRIYCVVQKQLQISIYSDRFCMTIRIAVIRQTNFRFTSVDKDVLSFVDRITFKKILFHHKSLLNLKV
jgi:hypothetical protein